MTEDVPKTITPIDYINIAYNEIFNILNKEMVGLLPNPVFTPVIFQIKFSSANASEPKVSVSFLNGQIRSHLYNISRYGYCNVSIRFEVKAKEIVASGRMMVKIFDPEFKKSNSANAIVVFKKNKRL